MSEEEIAQLHRQIRELSEQVRILGIHNQALQAQITGLQARPAPCAQDRWQGYKTTPGVYPFIEGGFDQLEVARWEATQKTAASPKNTTIYFRGASHTAVLPGIELYQAFTRMFGEYLKTNP